MIMPQCPFCDHANPSAAKFCNGCGSPLHLKPCLQCDAINAAASKACYMCGAFFAPPGSAAEALAIARLSRVGDAAADRDTSAERRPATRSAMATVVPVIVLGVIATSAYVIGYRQSGPLNEWLSAAWATVGANRGALAIPAAPLVAPAPPTEITTAPPSQDSVPAVSGVVAASPTAPPLQAMAPMPSLPQAATPAPATPAVRVEKKSSNGTKTAAKKSKSTTNKKPVPTQSRPAS